MNGKNTSPTRAALETAGGIFLSACTVYFAFYAREIFEGAHYPDWSLLRALCLIGLLTLGYSFYENRPVDS